MNTTHKHVALPLVSVITVNYNGLQFTREFLLSFSKVTYPAVEIIVVDNASRQSIVPLQQEFPHVHFILSDQNLGFAGGNNLGIRAAKGRYLLLINNDTEVEPGFLAPLVSLMESNKHIGMASPKLIYHHSPDTIQYAGGIAINPYTGRGRFIGHRQKNDGRYDRQQPTELAHGAAMMISRQVFEHVGLLPEQYFLYYEEIDFCESVKRAGYQIWYVPNSVVYHKESMSIGKDNPLKTYYLTRNRLLYLQRNTAGPTFWLSLLFFALFTVPRSSLLYLAKGRADLLKAFYKGISGYLFFGQAVHGNPGRTTP